MEFWWVLKVMLESWQVPFPGLVSFLQPHPAIEWQRDTKSFQPSDILWPEFKIFKAVSNDMVSRWNSIALRASQQADWSAWVSCDQFFCVICRLKCLSDLVSVIECHRVSSCGCLVRWQNLAEFDAALTCLILPNAAMRLLLLAKVPYPYYDLLKSAVHLYRNKSTTQSSVFPILACITFQSPSATPGLDCIIGSHHPPPKCGHECQEMPRLNRNHTAAESSARWQDCQS